MSVLPPGGTPRSLPPIKSGSASFGALSLPSLVPTLDPSSQLSDIRIDGEYFEIDLVSPAATPLPTNGVVWEIPNLTDILGNALPTFDILDHWHAEITTDGLIPDDLYVGIGISAGVVDAANVGVAAYLQGNGGTVNDASRAYGNSALWTQATVPGSALVRKASAFIGPFDLSGTTLRLRSHGVALYEADGTLDDVDAGAPINGTQPYDRAFLVAGFIAGTGVAATVRARLSFSCMPLAQIRANGG